MKCYGVGGVPCTYASAYEVINGKDVARYCESCFDEVIADLVKANGSVSFTQDSGGVFDIRWKQIAGAVPKTQRAV